MSKRYVQQKKLKPQKIKSDPKTKQSCFGRKTLTTSLLSLLDHYTSFEKKPLQKMLYKVFHALNIMEFLHIINVLQYFPIICVYLTLPYQDYSIPQNNLTMPVVQFTMQNK